MDLRGVDRVVIVPPSWPGDRNDYAMEAANILAHAYAQCRSNKGAPGVDQRENWRLAIWDFCNNICHNRT